MSILLLLFSPLIFAQTCPGGTTTTLAGCTNKCVYQINEGARWQPSTPITITVANEPVYFSSITCTDSKKNVKLTMSSDEDDFEVCLAPPTAGKCFSHTNPAGGQKCFETGSGWFGGNDGIMENVGSGTWVTSLKHRDGQSGADIELRAITLECTDEEGSNVMIIVGIALGCTAAALICFLCGFKYCYGGYLVETCCPCLGICCPMCMFPEGTELGDKDDCDDYMLWRCFSYVCFCCNFGVRSQEEREKEYKGDVEATKNESGL